MVWPSNSNKTHAKMSSVIVWGPKLSPYSPKKGSGRVLENQPLGLMGSRVSQCLFSSIKKLEGGGGVQCTKNVKFSKKRRGKHRFQKTNGRISWVVLPFMKRLNAARSTTCPLRQSLRFCFWQILSPAAMSKTSLQTEKQKKNIGDKLPEEIDPKRQTEALP